MCDFRKGFLLCTCNEDKAQNKKNNETKEYEWTLYKYEGAETSGMMGKIILPAADLGKGLETPFVLSELNKRNCFDFDYKPRNGDNLIIRKLADPFLRLEFIFRDMRWQDEFYNRFIDKVSPVAKGKIQNSG